MPRYLLKRCLGTIPLLLSISFLSFILIELVPVDPAEVSLRVNEIMPTPEAIALVRSELGLDKPFVVRYFDWLVKAVQFDFGKSYINNRYVSDEILRCLPATLKLAAAALFLMLAISLPIGILGAIRPNSIYDRFIRVLMFLGTAMPSYWVGLLLIWLFAIKLDLLPTNGSGSWKHIILPASALSFTYISIYARLIRSNMLENMAEPYVLYARVRGLPENKIMFGMVFRNSIQTSITALGMSIPQLLAGTVIIENIFSWPGIGRLCILSIFNRDYPVIQAYILMMAILFVFCNLTVDIVHQIIDPRLRQS